MRMTGRMGPRQAGAIPLPRMGESNLRTLDQVATVMPP
jgi:hypothetical protein